MSDARCEEYRELVSAFIDGWLGGAELLLLESHLEVCPGCRAFEEELRGFSGWLRAAEVFRPLRRPPPGFAAKVTALAAMQFPVVPFPGFRPTRRVSRVSWLGMVASTTAGS